MKISSFVKFMVIIAAVFFIFALMIKDIADYYPDANINISEWEDKYDYIDDINKTTAPIEKKLQAIQDTDSGWFQLALGVTAIPYAIMVVAVSVFGGIGFAGEMIVNFFAVFNLPAQIVAAAILLLSLFGIFKLLEWYQKKRI